MGRYIYTTDFYRYDYNQTERRAACKTYDGHLAMEITSWAINNQLYQLARDNG